LFVSTPYKIYFIARSATGSRNCLCARVPFPFLAMTCHLWPSNLNCFFFQFRHPVACGFSCCAAAVVQPIFQKYLPYMLIRHSKVKWDALRGYPMLEDTAPKLPLRIYLWYPVPSRDLVRTCTRPRTLDQSLAAWNAGRHHIPCSWNFVIKLGMGSTQDTTPLWLDHHLGSRMKVPIRRSHLRQRPDHHPGSREKVPIRRSLQEKKSIICH
jgi:hypothetical protein